MVFAHRLESVNAMETILALTVHNQFAKCVSMGVVLLQVFVSVLICGVVWHVIPQFVQPLLMEVLVLLMESALHQEYVNVIPIGQVHCAKRLCVLGDALAMDCASNPACANVTMDGLVIIVTLHLVPTIAVNMELALLLTIANANLVTLISIAQNGAA